MKKLMKTFKYISVLILALSFIGCEDDDVVLPKVTAGFTYTVNVDTGTVTFINISENGQNYEWDFGDGKSSTLINPVKVYPNGTYTVILKAKNVSGAYDTFQDEITIAIPEKIGLPISFDNANVNYGAEAFSGTSFEIVDNPAPGGSNTDASKVGAITNSGNQFEGIAFELGEAINLATEKTIKMDFWSDKPVSILLKLEISESDFAEVTVSHGGTGWEELAFDFSSSKTYPKLVIFVDGPLETTGTFYFDNIVQEETPAPLCDVETEQSLNASDLNITFLSDPAVAGGDTTLAEDNVTYEYADNPDSSTDANKSCKVGKITKSGVQPWDNLQINFADKFVFTDGANFTLKVYSPVAGYNVTIKLEDKTTEGAVNSGDVLSTTQTTKTNEWEELTIPFNAIDSGKYDKMVIFFDLQGDANTNVYYIDDIKLNAGNGGGSGNCAAETMQSLNTSGFDLTFMSDPGTTPTKGGEVGKFFQDNATYEYVDNPDFSSAANNSCKVGKVTKSNVQPWDNIQIDFADKFTFTDGSNFTIKVFSPESGYKVTLKLEDKTTDGGVNSGDRESTTSTTKTNEWEELTIPFGVADSGKYDKLVIFFDLATANSNTYYFDDLKLNLGSGGGGGGGGNTNCPTPAAGEFIVDGDFEANADCWELIQIQAGTSSTIVSDVNNGGTNSARVKTAPGGNPGIKQTRFGVGVIQPSSNYVVTFDIRADASDPVANGSILNAATFSEAAENSGTGATRHNLIQGEGNISSTWTTKTLPFTTAANVDGGLSLLIELIGGGATTTGTIYIDNVSLKAAP